MCEIALIPTDDVETLRQASMNLFYSQRSSLGITSVFDSGDTFEYETYKSIDPDDDDVAAFFDTTTPGAEFHIIHGRLATQGAVIGRNAHPLPVECSECNVDYVIHNGIISQYHKQKAHDESEGHAYETDVDSELIAHHFADVPDDFDFEIANVYERQPGFLLLNDERIYAKMGRTYHMTDEPRIAKIRRPFAPQTRETNYDEMIITPTGDN